MPVRWQRVASRTALVGWLVLYGLAIPAPAQADSSDSPSQQAQVSDTCSTDGVHLGCARAAEPECRRSACGDSSAQPTGSDDRAGYYFLGAIPLIVGLGGAFGADHRLHDDDSGIWKRRNQLTLEYAVIATEVGGGLWEGGENRLGRSYWESLDASIFSALTVQALKYATGRARPSQSSSPGEWRQGSCCQSFPSGEVTLQASFVTPFILEYQDDHPWVWGLEALPLYDAVARVKTQGHWQTDVLAAWALGTAFGIFAHDRDMPFFLGVMPHGVMVGWHTSF